MKQSLVMILFTLALSGCQTSSEKISEERILNNKYNLTQSKKVGGFSFSYSKPDQTRNWEYLMSISPVPPSLRDQKFLSALFDASSEICKSNVPNANTDKIGVISKRPIVDKQSQTSKLLMFCHEK
ncbi:lipoprotein [Flexibacterium corallicola]|uniref:lipoprotein n=1 Tax=Flexibacterium corallicola TaxID=3037259 RepID=UPI00286EBC63|nr:lipoprotein [Pseudovibrio sp. M1P-2-3]